MTDRPYWKILPAGAALCSLTVFALSANLIPSVLFHAARDFQVLPELLAMTTTLQFLGFIVATIAGGIFADRIGQKKVFLVACVLTAIGAASWASSASLAGALVGSLVMGMGGGILESMSSALLSDLFPDRRKLALNLSQAAYCLGAAAGPFLIGTLLTRPGASWRLGFGALAALATALLVLYALARIPQPAEAEAISLPIFTRIIRQWSFICPCLAIFLYVFAETVHLVFINYYLRKQLHAPENWAIYGLAGFWLAMTLGRIGCALIPEAVSNRKLIAVLMLLSGLLMSAHPLIREWPASIALFALTGFVFSGTWPLLIGLTAKLNPGYSGTVIGVTIAAGAVGCVVAAPVMGLGFRLLPLPVAFSGASLSLLAGSALILFAQARPGRRAKKASGPA